LIILNLGIEKVLIELSLREMLMWLTYFKYLNYFTLKNSRKKYRA
jgi:hypothetical protein